MKAIKLLSVAMLMLITSARAQIGSRLLSYVDLSYIGNHYIIADSINNIFSGNRGGDLSSPYIKYDTQIVFYYDTVTLYSNQNRNIQTFDANENVATHISQLWNTNTSSWRNNKKSSYTHTNNIETYQLQQNWDTTGNVWVNAEQYTSTLNANNQVDSLHSETWDAVTSVWENDGQSINSYNPAHQLVQERNLAWNGSTWVNASNIIYTYDANNNEIDNDVQNWNTTNNTWDEVFRTLTVWDAAGDKLNYVDQIYQFSAWYNFDSIVNSNFVGHDPQIVLKYDFGGNPTPHDSILSVYTYNTYGQVLTYSGTSVDTSGVWQPMLFDQGARYHYETYTLPNAIASIANNGGTATVYPIPSNDVLNITLTWNQPQPCNIAIFDLEGRTIRNWNVPETAVYNTSVSTSSIPAGSYFMKVTGENGQIIKQVTIVH